MNKLKTLKVVSAYGLVLSLICAGFLMVFSAHGPVAVFDNNLRIEKLSMKEPVWCLDKCSSTVRFMNVVSKVSPITNNPKVRRLSYTVRVEIVDLHDYFNSIGLKPKHGTNSLFTENAVIFQRTVEYELYEFNNTHSKELAAFYNPLDRKQTADLAALLKQHINPKLVNSGLAIIELVSWQVE